jgi:hypothetical protein
MKYNCDDNVQRERRECKEVSHHFRATSHIQTTYLAIKQEEHRKHKIKERSRKKKTYTNQRRG